MMMMIRMTGIHGGAAYQFKRTRHVVGDLYRRLTQLHEPQRSHEDEQRRGKKDEDELLKDEGEVEAIATGRVDNRAERCVCGGSTKGG